MSNNLSVGYFDVQLRFADFVAQVSELSFEEAVLRFTNIYLQCLNRSFNANHPVWRAYLEGLRGASDRARWTFDFCKSRRKAVVSRSSFGCFQYVYWPEEEAIHFHFINEDVSDNGPLSKERRVVRLLELKEMFAEVKLVRPEAKRVQGCSWLYNIEAYKRLFPTEYTKMTEIVDVEWQFLSLWGQFLQRNGQVRLSLVANFLEACRQQRTLEGLKSCFPYQVLETECSIDEFYAFYDSISF